MATVEEGRDGHRNQEVRRVAQTKTGKPTEAELREHANAKRIAVYSRLNKLALIEALDPGPST